MSEPDLEPPDDRHCPGCCGCRTELPDDCEYCEHAYHAGEDACQERSEARGPLVPCLCEGAVMTEDDLCEPGMHRLCEFHLREAKAALTEDERDE